jgi:hypothetical protein
MGTDPKETSGTASASALVSSFAAIIAARYPSLSMKQVARCILESATPIILLGDLASFKRPVALDIMAYQMDGPGEYADTDGSRHFVSTEMIEESWETFGQGRVHLEHALQLASQLAELGEDATHTRLV